MKPKATLLSLALLTGLAGFFAPHISEAAFGISPPFINASHLVKGADFSQTVYLIQDQPNQDMPIAATLNIPDNIKSWVAIDTGTNFIIPKGVQQFPVTITFHVPQDADLGSYHGNVSFTTVPAKSGQVTIALGVQVSLNLSIGNDIYEKFEVPIVKPMDIEEGWDPRVLVRFRNEGNVPEAFTGASFELLDQYGAARLAFTQKNEGFPATPSFKEQEYIIEFPMDFHLGVGQYWANVIFYQGDTPVASQKTVFNVLKAGSINGTTAQIINYINKHQAYAYGIGGLILIFGVSAFLKRRRPA